MTPAERLVCRVARLWAPPPELTVSEWADRYRFLSPESAAEHGKWQTLPFQREPLDSISDPRIRRTVIKSATQMLKTVAIENAIGYFASQDPGPMLVLQPGETDARDFSKERIAPMIRDTPTLKTLFSESRSRDSDNTITEKLFPGGMLALAGAGSARNVARRAIRFLFCDEIDKYDVTSEGNPLPLARKRLATFRHRSKEINTCSPTIEDSEIDKAYAASDQRQYYVPCPECGHMQSMMLKFRTQVRWDQTAATLEERARTARYHCEACDLPWDDADRMKAVEAGQWIASSPFAGIAGFWISELYSPWKQLWEIVLDYLTKKDNVEDLRVFVNTSLAENWVDDGDAPEWQTILDRREAYPAGTVPKGGLFVTVGADVHPDRIEAEAVAWGRDKQSWSLAYEIFNGRASEPQVWCEFEAFVGRVFPHPSGQNIPISRTFVDSGNSTNDVYGWVRTQSPDRVVAVKGDDRGAIPVSQPSFVDVTVEGKKLTDGLRIKTVKVSFFKAGFYADLKKRPPTEEEQAAGMGFPPGYCHFPKDGRNYGDEHFKQICAEQIVTRKNPRTKRLKTEFVQTRDRNEALDCRVYARAAAWDFGLDQAQDIHWLAFEESLKVVEQTLAKPDPVDPAPNDHPMRSGYRDPWVGGERQSGGKKNWFARR